MTFDDVLKDIRRLRGISLHSIRPGANLIIAGFEDEAIVIKASDGRRLSRSLDELRSIWKALCNQPAVHVDSLLGGSGSSRNQPETIMANLPYVEHLWLQRKKHLTLVGAPSHRLGSLQEASGELMEEVRGKLQRLRTVWGDDATTVVFSSDPRASAATLEKVTGQTAEAVEQGLYRIKGTNQTLLIATSPPQLKDAAAGTYIVVRSSGAAGGTKVDLGGKEYLAVKEGGVNLLIEKAR